ncbi:MAG TPA: DUF4112 domain-containing protein [Caulobacteraceae bacterium]|jgi:hypothetical protein|nr:DUF4112 domain-containing protein [Caulobacteraceae bacterium]
MFARSHKDLHRVRRSVERVKALSDRVVGIGPFGVGMDGITAWIPGLGALYTVGAAGFLMLQAVRARAGARTLLHMGAVLFVDAVTDLVPVPVAPAVFDMMFTGHKWAANALLRQMDRTIYYEGARAEGEADPEFRAHLDDLKRTGGGRRVVYLG